jgi:hypothetical protein
VTSRTAISPTTITTEPMRELPARLTPEQVDARRKAVRRTALLFALIAVAIYVGFILTGSP